MTQQLPRMDATILGAASLLALAAGGGAAGIRSASAARYPCGEPMTPAELVGLWTSADRTVHLELHLGGRYDRGITGRSRTAAGSYRVQRSALMLRDDSGLPTTVSLVGAELEMAGHRLLRHPRHHEVPRAATRPAGRRGPRLR